MKIWKIKVELRRKKNMLGFFLFIFVKRINKVYKRDWLVYMGSGMAFVKLHGDLILKLLYEVVHVVCTVNQTCWQWIDIKCKVWFWNIKTQFSLVENVDRFFRSLLFLNLFFEANTWQSRWCKTLLFQSLLFSAWFLIVKRMV